MDEAPTLNVQDLTAIVKIIDACAERGAFRGNELASVGAVRERINAFAVANTPVEEPQENGNEDLGDTNDGDTSIESSDSED